MSNGFVGSSPQAGSQVPRGGNSASSPTPSAGMSPRSRRPRGAPPMTKRSCLESGLRDGSSGLLVGPPEGRALRAESRPDGEVAPRDFSGSDAVCLAAPHRFCSPLECPGEGFAPPSGRLPGVVVCDVHPTGPDGRRSSVRMHLPSRAMVLQCSPIGWRRHGCWPDSHRALLAESELPLAMRRLRPGAGPQTRVSAGWTRSNLHQLEEAGHTGIEIARRVDVSAETISCLASPGPELVH